MRKYLGLQCIYLYAQQMSLDDETVCTCGTIGSLL